MAQWRSLHSVHQRIHDELNCAISPEGVSLVEFALLDILEEQVDGHLRMQDVACVAGLSTGAATRLVNRLEDRGLLVRVLCSEDRRGIYTELTDLGRDMLARTRPLHDAALRACFSDDANCQVIGSVAAMLERR